MANSNESRTSGEPSDKQAAIKDEAIEDDAHLSEDEAALMNQLTEHGASRREFLGLVSAAGMSLFALQTLAEHEALAAGNSLPQSAALANEISPVAVKVRINGALASQR